jgi:hypothetical protein
MVLGNIQNDVRVVQVDLVKILSARLLHVVTCYTQ